MRKTKEGDRLQSMGEAFELSHQGADFKIPRPNLLSFFDHHPELIPKTSYVVKSRVSPEVFQIFANALATGTKVPITKENIPSISLLAREFSLEDLLSDASILSDRVSTLESQLASLPLDLILDVSDTISNHERQLERVSRIAAMIPSLRTEFDDLRDSVLQLQITVAHTQSHPELSSFTRDDCIDAFQSFLHTDEPIEAAIFKVDCAFREPRSVDGIISYLTQKHGGNVHDIEMVTITSKSIFSDDASYAGRNLANFDNDAYFATKDEPGQWVCWNFHKMRIQLSHYTIVNSHMKSWILEGSMDGVNWEIIDEQRNNTKLMDDPYTDSFPVSNPLECTFIRMTQTGPDHDESNYLAIEAFEFFGALQE
jgi:hypothetical protein